MDTDNNLTPGIDEQLEQMRAEWNAFASELSERIDRQTRTIESRVAASDIPDVKRQLLRTILIPNAAAVCGIIAVQIFAVTHPALMVCAVIFFVAMAALRCFFAWRVRSLDPYTDTISETLRKIISLQRLHTVILLIGLSMAIPLLVWMLTVLTSDYGTYALFGGIAGLIFGAVCGACLCMRSRRLIRSLADQLKEA